MPLSAKRHWNKLAVLARLETDYGTSAAPSGPADGMQMTEVSLTPLAGEEASRDLMRPYFGHQGALLVGDHVELEGAVELAGSGIAGTVPACSPLLRACALSETVVATTSVTYTPVSTAAESATIFANLDGVNHALLGARGTFTVEFAPKGIARLKFKLRGLFGPVADMALPAVNLSKFKLAVPVNNANTTLSLFGVAQVSESLSFDLGNELTTRTLIGEDSILISDRKVTGTAVVEARALAVQDWLSIARARTRGALILTHGTAAGNMIQLNAPAVEIGRPTYGKTDGITNMSIPLMFCPTVGDDDFTLAFK